MVAARRRSASSGPLRGVQRQCSAPGSVVCSIQSPRHAHNWRRRLDPPDLWTVPIWTRKPLTAGLSKDLAPTPPLGRAVSLRPNATPSGVNDLQRSALPLVVVVLRLKIPSIVYPTDATSR